VLHLMQESMVGRVDPLPIQVFKNKILIDVQITVLFILQRLSIAPGLLSDQRKDYFGSTIEYYAMVVIDTERHQYITKLSCGWYVHCH
jgi:hypothetical protein